MNLVVNSQQMKGIDTFTCEQIGIPAIVLMERAALKVAEEIKKHADKKTKILAVCGLGNNGADGIATARILYSEGYQVDILLVGDETRALELTKQQINIAANLSISIYNNINLSEYTILIDAIFGIGLNRPITGIYEDIINEINNEEKLVFSVDVPSGLSTDTARPQNVAVKANYTITFGLTKLGLILYPGCEYAGNVIVVDIGFPQKAIDNYLSNCFFYDSYDLLRLPKRENYSNKGTFGKVLIIAGSFNMSGACYFSAKSAYRTGAGLVKVVTTEENRTIIQSSLPEVILTTYQSNSNEINNINKIVADIEWASVIVIGPGIGNNSISEQILDLVINKATVPIIIDADAINILSNKLNKLVPNMNSNDRIKKLTKILPEQTILTPHLKELSKLINNPVNEVMTNLLPISNLCTSDNNLIFVMKDARTIVAHENSRYINVSGNNGMATGGSGDVLTGIIAALIAQGLDAREAAMLGVYVHGLAGDIADKKKGKYSMMAS
ncbi:MAG: hypothetical protein K0S41_3338, partial [Anaerocolumna sp.]|nr:hypothetical protein [Anaerocolumna sp.]